MGAFIKSRFLGPISRDSDLEGPVGRGLSQTSVIPPCNFNLEKFQINREVEKIAQKAPNYS